MKNKTKIYNGRFGLAVNCEDMYNHAYSAWEADLKLIYLKMPLHKIRT